MVLLYMHTYIELKETYFAVFLDGTHVLSNKIIMSKIYMHADDSISQISTYNVLFLVPVSQSNV